MSNREQSGAEQGRADHHVEKGKEAANPPFVFNEPMMEVKYTFQVCIESIFSA
jgi:hypothetical protein